jgi:hypothetical protein
VLPGVARKRFSMVGIGEETAWQLPPLFDRARAGPTRSFPVLLKVAHPYLFWINIRLPNVFPSDTKGISWVPIGTSRWTGDQP